MNLLNKAIVLKLNKHFLVLRVEQVSKIFIDLAKDTVRALNISYFQNPDGSYDFDNVVDITPTKWEDWIKLPIRDCDLYVQTPRIKVRVPTVCVCSHYSAVPMRRIKLCAKSIYERDGGRCQYTNRKLGKGEWNLEHVTPRARGGKTSWTNIVLADKNINSMKGDKMPHEVGLKLIRQPKAPLPTPASVSVKEVLHRDWKHFLIK